jgi:hypothetical protein
VPPQGAGWVRLAWKDQEQGQKTLSAVLRTVCSVGNAPPFRLEVGALFSDPVLVWPEKKEVGVEDLRVGDDRPRVAWFTVYSSTRPRLTLEPEPESEQKAHHPFVTCGKPVPVDAKECPGLEWQFKRAVTCAYRVPVTVRERTEDGREHDLGPFHTTVALKTDAQDEPLGLTVTGSVRGVVKVLGGGDDEAHRDRITLGAFPRSSGISRTVTLETAPDVDVVLDTAPAFLKAELTPPEKGKDGLTRWSLTVTLAANAVSGQFGRPQDALGDTSVYLKANGRRVRVPVSGTATQR